MLLSGVPCWDALGLTPARELTRLSDEVNRLIETICSYHSIWNVTLIIWTIKQEYSAQWGEQSCI